MKISVNPIFLIVICIFLSACVKIPSQSVDLINSIHNEGKRMHELNIALVNHMFKEKREKIDYFVQQRYISEFTQDVVKLIPVDANIEDELPGILSEGISLVTGKRNLMQSTLEEQRIKLITKLEKDALIFEETCRELKYLLRSAIKVEKEKQNIYTRIAEVSSRKIDLNEVERLLDKFITTTGEIGEGITDLNNGINSLTK